MATLLNETDIANIVIKRASGAKQVDLARDFNSSTDRMLDIQKRDIRTKILDIKKDYFTLKRNGLNDNEVPYLKLTGGDLICKNCEQTGNILDGVLIIKGKSSAIWESDEHHCTNYDIYDFEFADDDIGALKPFKIGVIFHAKYDDPVLNLTSSINNLWLDFGKVTLEENQSKKIGAVKTSVDVVNELLDEAEVITDKIDNAIANAESEKSETVPEDEYIWNASNKFISISVGRDVYNADETHERFKDALQCLVDGKIKDALDLISIEKAITEYVQGNITIKDCELYYNGYNLKNGLTGRIIESMQNKEDFKFYLPFLDNLMENPSEKAVNRLFDFLEANDIKITDDGYFIAWKKVRHDYFDIYSGTKNNAPGESPSVPRNQVDEDDNVTCSRGLHVCAKSYLSHFGSCVSTDRIVSVKVHPKDVVSIPKDYKNAKMRTCGYVVVEDVTETFNK